MKSRVTCSLNPYIRGESEPFLGALGPGSRAPFVSACKREGFSVSGGHKIEDL